MVEINQIISIKQLPIIEEKLLTLEQEIKDRTSRALSLIVTDDTVKEIKQIRADLTKEFKKLEEVRKGIKKQVLEPYEEFEQIYKAVTSHYSIADKELASRIAEVEQVKKDEKREKAKEYFDELLISLGLHNFEFITFERINLNINLSVSLKSLKENIKNSLEKINSEISSIQDFENKNEIFVEYSKTLDLANSIKTVNDRKKQIEEQSKRNEKLQEVQEKQQETINKVEELIAPKVKQPDEEELLQVTFTVTGTLAKLKELKEFLNNGGYIYE